MTANISFPDIPVDNEVHVEFGDLMFTDVNASTFEVGAEFTDNDKADAVQIEPGIFEIQLSYASGSNPGKHFKFFLQRKGKAGSSSREWSPCYLLVKDGCAGIPSCVTCA